MQDAVIKIKIVFLSSVYSTLCTVHGSIFITWPDQFKKRPLYLNNSVIPVANSHYVLICIHPIFWYTVCLVVRTC